MVEGVEGPAASPAPFPFLPLEGRARWAVVALGVVAALAAIAFIFDYLDYDLRDRIASGASYTQGDIDASDLRVGVLAFIQFAAFIATAVFFIRWFHRAYRNLRAVDGLQRYGEGWAIGAWFVPILNLFRPKQIANDIWRGSDPQTPWRVSDATEKVSALLGWWWAAFIVSAWIGNRATVDSFGGNSASDLLSADALSMVSDVFTIAAALLAIAVVRAMTTRQSARAEARAEQP